MTVITLTTVGFGEVHELSLAGRAFTVLLVLFGLGAAATFAAQFARLLVEGDLRDYWRKRQMERQLSRLKGHVIVCGYGRIGKSICQELKEMGAQCVVVESSEERQAEAREQRLMVMPGNATSDVALLSAGVVRAAVIVAALSHDTDNVFVALSARDLNPELVIIARAEDRSIEARMLKAGVNRVVCPAQLGGGRIAHMVGEELGLDVESVEFRRASDVLGYDLRVYRNQTGEPLTLNEIEVSTGAVRALALVRRDGSRIEDPPPDMQAEAMEAVVLLVDATASARERQRKASLLKQVEETLGMELLR
jgi:voltage-gated potassium channel Kch